MASVAKILLSDSTDGAPIAITATGTPGTAIHTAVTGTADFDEVWIWAVNNHSANVEMEIEWSNTTAAENIVQTIGFDSGLTLVVPGLVLQNGDTIAAFDTQGSVIAIYGYVNRITA